jgi:hypothetical protein
MRTRILRLVGGATIALSLAAAGAGVASADTFLGTTNGCKDYIDSHGHITTICRSPADLGFVAEDPQEETAQKIIWHRGPEGLSWPGIVR